MKRLFVRALIFAGWIAGGLAADAKAQVATYSLEAVAVNDVPLADGPLAMVSAAPGDQIVVHVRLRDWSPNGEAIRGYQAQLEPASFFSGEAGHVMPVDFDRARDEDRNNADFAYIDQENPLYVYLGQGVIPLVDTRNAPGYRWLSVPLDQEKGRVSPQDGTRFYCGTVHYEVSQDARGEFKLRLVEDPNASGLIGPDGLPMFDIHYEPLTVIIKEGSARYRIVGSDPPAGAIDARIPASATPRLGGWSRITLTLNGPAVGLQTSDFTLEDGTSNPPTVIDLSSNSSNVTLHLDRQMTVGAWTVLTYVPSTQRIRFGVLPGDVNNDGVSDSRDMLALVNAVNGTVSLPAYQADINRDGRIDNADLLRAIELLDPTQRQPAYPRKLPR